MARLSLHLLGSFQAALDSEPVTAFSTDKARALLAYLAVEADRPHRREALAGLLWPDQPQRKARQNFRQALSYLRQAIGEPDDAASFLRVSRETVQFNPESDCWLDVAAFTTLVAACQSHRHRRLETCRSCVRRLKEAVKLYRGGFLEQFSVGDSTLFEDWALLKREWLHRQAVEALSCLTRYHERRGEYGLARRHAWRHVELEPWREEAHRQLMRALALEGQRSAALAQFKRCRQALAEELGVEPTDETVTLYERIRAGMDLTSAPLHNLPPSPTPFIGREKELVELADLLADPGCRLLTLVGPGGIGKTRLALQAAADQIGAFVHGVHLVPLVSVSSAEFIVSTMADALEFSFDGHDVKEQLLSFLRGKEKLLVLDDMEHLLEAGGLLAEILERAPDVVLLVTSRERLNLQEEWVYEVEGLAYPKDLAARKLGGYSAVALFVQSARRLQRKFELGEQNQPFVAQICRLVEGMPLGVELAAAWVRARTCEEIAQEITRNLDILTTSLRNVPERHRSLRAAFEHSWNLLSEQERAVFRKLSVFLGGFRDKAAEQVTGASLLTLSSLVDKSLLRRDASGRYEMHELLRQYAAEKLETVAEEKIEASDRHCAHYAAFLQEKESRLQGERQKGAVREIGTEIENVRAGWRWAVAHDRLAEIDRSLSCLSRFYLLRGPFQEGEALIRAAVDNVRASIGRGDAAGPDAQIILAKLLTEQARLLNEQAVYDQAIAASQAAIELARASRSQNLVARCHLLWGQALWLQGNFEAAQNQLEQALSLSRAATLRQPEADSLLTLGNISLRQGNLAQARDHYGQALGIFRALGDQRGESSVLNNLGVADYRQGHHTEAIASQKKALRIRRELGDWQGEGKSLNNLGNCFAELGDYTEARVYYEQALSIYGEIGHRRGEGIVLNNLSALFWSQGDYAAAWDCYDQALHICREIGDQQGEGQTLSNLSLLAHLRGEDEAALDYGQQALCIAQELGDRPNQGETLTRIGHAQAGLRRLAESAAAYQQALALRRELGTLHLAMETLAGLAAVYLAQSDLIQARAQVEEILSYLENNTLDGTDEPFRVYLTCYRVLRANQDPRAPTILTTAHRLLQEQAARIGGEELRRSFLENVAVHREIVTAFAESEAAGLRPAGAVED